MNTEYYKKYEPIFNSWYIVKLIGQGSFGQVYEIERKELGVTYKAALKTITIPQNPGEVKSLLAEGMSKDEVIEYYQDIVHGIVNEFILMSKLKGNSNIVSYEDHTIIEHKDGIGWDILIRMELLMPLFDYIAQNPMTRRDVVKLGIDMCKALELCQQHNIVHRDVKPENMFVSSSGNFKLGDFGIAKTIEKTGGDMSRKGTYTYMAPEVYRGELYGSTVDIYSLGIVLYRLLNENRTPFLPDYPHTISFSDKENALIKRISGENIPAPKNADGRLKDIVLKACAHNPKGRYESPLQMRRELEAILNPVDDKKIDNSLRYTESLSRNSGDETQLMTELEDETTVLMTDNYKTLDEKLIYGFSSNAFRNYFEDGKSKRTNKKDKLLLIIPLVLFITLMVFIASNTISSAQKTEIFVDDPLIIFDKDGIELDYALESSKYYKSNVEIEVKDPDVIEVTADGMILPKEFGRTELTFKIYDEYSKTIDIYSLINNTITVREGEYCDLYYDFEPEDFGSTQPLYYIVGDNSIAFIDDDGRLYGNSAGMTSITLCCEDEAVCDFNVKVLANGNNNFKNQLYCFRSDNAIMVSENGRIQVADAFKNSFSVDELAENVISEVPFAGFTALYAVKIKNEYFAVYPISFSNEKFQVSTNGYTEVRDVGEGQITAKYNGKIYKMKIKGKLT